ncbi:hypothetical protein K458DRAFT_282937, partial [Lentithecium fluviatile CBS 122367]
DKWLSRWPALVNGSKRYNIENLSESQICDAFVEASRDINPPFYNYMKSKEAQVESDTSLIQNTARTIQLMAEAVITALNEINPTHVSTGAVTTDSPDASDFEETDDDADMPILDKARIRINRALRSFRSLNPALSD